MNNASALARALRGPIMLTTLGVLFVADHMSSWPFYRTWPVLIIVFGLMKFIEIATVRSQRDQAAGPFPGGTAS